MNMVATIKIKFQAPNPSNQELIKDPSLGSLIEDCKASFEKKINDSSLGELGEVFLNVEIEEDEKIREENMNFLLSECSSLLLAFGNIFNSMEESQNKFMVTNDNKNLVSFLAFEYDQYCNQYFKQGFIPAKDLSSRVDSIIETTKKPSDEVPKYSCIFKKNIIARMMSNKIYDYLHFLEYKKSQFENVKKYKLFPFDIDLSGDIPLTDLPTNTPARKAIASIILASRESNDWSPVSLGDIRTSNIKHANFCNSPSNYAFPWITDPAFGYDFNGPINGGVIREVKDTRNPSKTTYQLTHKGLRFIGAI